MFKNLIFDWSGTLVDDLALTLDASNYVFRQYGKEELSTEQFREEFQLPYPNYYANVLPDADLNELEDHFREAFRISEEPVEVLPHAREFMEWCKARGIRCFALTSVDAKEFMIQCQDLGMKDYFEAIHAGIRHKDEHIHSLLEQHGLNPNETAFIGDMQHDIETAHVGGITGIAVLTGYNSPKQLAKAKPHMIVPNLHILQNLFDKLSSNLPNEDIKPSTNEIEIKGLKLECHIGVPEEERLEPQTLLADISLIPNTRFETMRDDIAMTVDYAALTERLEREAGSKTRKLIETLADDLLSVCLETQGVSHAKVTIRKFILPQTDYVSVSTSR